LFILNIFFLVGSAILYMEPTFPLVAASQCMSEQLAMHQEMWPAVHSAVGCMARSPGLLLPPPPSPCGGVLPLLLWLRLPMGLMLAASSLPPGLCLGAS
jgi:hypothetical protein